MGATSDFERTDRPSTAQPPPLARPDLPAIADLVAADVLSRKDFGIRKYGMALTAHNGRDPLQDAYEEALDLVAYLRQAIEERRVRRSWQTPVHINPTEIPADPTLRHQVLDKPLP